MEARLKQIIQATHFENLIKRYGFAYYNRGDYDINIIGVRNLLNGFVQSNKFDDAIVLIYKEKGRKIKLVCDATTDPSIYHLKNYNKANKGCAILCHGQYRGAYWVYQHKGQYEACCQKEPVKVFRDSNKDNKLDMNINTVQTGKFGINIHRASAVRISETIGKYSAGCQVFKSYKDFNHFMTILNRAKSRYGNQFTYTLFTSSALILNL